MRSSSAVLTDTSVRLWDLLFPADRPLLARTRSAYVHLDNLIAYSKRDRDAKVHAYLAAYRPDETILLFFLGGELVNATVITPVGRYAVAISEAMKHLRAEPERSEVTYQVASPALLAAMYATCTQPAIDLALDVTSPKTVFENVLARKWTGLLELISNSRVNYLTVKEGRFASGIFSDQRPNEDAKSYLSRLFTARHPEPQPKVTVCGFTGLEQLPRQAPPALVQVFRQYVWDLVELAQKEGPADALKRAERIRMKLCAEHEALMSVGGVRNATFADPIIEPRHFSDAVAQWTRDFLGELEVTHPTIAPRLLKEACREARFQFAALGFFEKLPWKIEW